MPEHEMVSVRAADVRALTDFLDRPFPRRRLTVEEVAARDVLRAVITNTSAGHDSVSHHAYTALREQLAEAVRLLREEHGDDFDDCLACTFLATQEDETMTTALPPHDPTRWALDDAKDRSNPPIPPQEPADLDALRQRLVDGMPFASTPGTLALHQHSFLLGVDATLAALEQDSMHDYTGYCHRDEPFTHAAHHPVYRIKPDPEGADE